MKILKCYEVETPTNPMLNIIDINKLSSISKEKRFNLSSR